jgi:two-component system invasion response regulator UvrY
MIRTLIADDHPVVRTGLKRILAQSPDIEVSAEASSGRQALNMIGSMPLDVVLLDLTMPDGMGVEVLKTIKGKHPDLAVLVVSMHGEDRFGRQVLKAGASGYITKDHATEHLIPAIRRVVTGRKYISQALEEALTCDLDADDDRPLHEKLSDREHQVLGLIAEGKTVGEIAEELKISPKTVSTYRTRILEKLRLERNTELTRYALMNGLVEVGGQAKPRAPRSEHTH